MNSPKWPFEALGKVARIFAGSAAPQGNEHFSVEGPPFFRVSDLSAHGRTRNLVGAAAGLSREALETMPLVRARKGSVLFPKSGAAIATNNRAILGVDGYIVSHLMGIEPGDQVDSNWIYWWLCNVDMRSLSDNDAYPSLKQSTIEQLKIPVPPLAEQRRIAEILNEQMIAVETCRDAISAQASSAHGLFVMRLKEMFSEIASSTGERKRLADVAALRPSRSVSTDGNVEVEVVTTASLTESGFDNRGIKLARMKARDVADCMLKPGEILIARSNTPELVGRAAMFPGNERQIVAGDLTIRIESGPRLLPEFLAGYLSYLYVTKYWIERAGGASGTMKKITRTQIEALEIPVPSLELQEKTIAKLRAISGPAKHAVEAISQCSEAIASLPAAYLRKAFAGRF